MKKYHIILIFFLIEWGRLLAQSRDTIIEFPDCCSFKYTQMGDTLSTIAFDSHLENVPTNGLYLSKIDSVFETKMVIFDRYGTGKAMHYKNGKIVWEGSYIGNETIHEGKSIKLNPATFQEFENYYWYHLAIKDGFWLYWDDKGELICLEIYDNGKLVNKIKR